MTGANKFAILLFFKIYKKLIFNFIFQLFIGLNGQAGLPGLPGQKGESSGPGPRGQMGPAGLMGLRGLFYKFFIGDLNQ